jgi:Resolvase, N terminal domain
MRIGYARVSTTEQNLDLQRDALKRAGCDKIIEDTASGGKVLRSGLERVREMLRPGDVLAVWRLDRLGRSLKHLIDLMAELEDQGMIPILKRGFFRTFDDGGPPEATYDREFPGKRRPPGRLASLDHQKCGRAEKRANFDRLERATWDVCFLVLIFQVREEFVSFLVSFLTRTLNVGIRRGIRRGHC